MRLIGFSRAGSFPAGRIEATLLAVQRRRWRSGGAVVRQSAHVTAPLQAVASTTMPNAMRYQAKPTKVWLAM